MDDGERRVEREGIRWDQVFAHQVRRADVEARDVWRGRLEPAHAVARARARGGRFVLEHDASVPDDRPAVSAIVRHRSLFVSRRELAGWMHAEGASSYGGRVAREEHSRDGEPRASVGVVVVRMLSPAPSSSLVTRVRLHESGGTYKKARLLIASSPLRAGASLLGEALATSSNHPLHSALWERDGSVRSDSYFANFINLGDWWSVSEVPKDDDASWRGKLRKFLLDIGVKEATVDASFTYPGEFLNEVLSRSGGGVDKVYVSLIGVHVDSTPRELDRMEKLFKSILESVAETPLVICLGRDNKLDMYVSTVRAMNGDARTANS